MSIKQGDEELTPRAAEELRFAEAKLGVDAEKFLSTTLGKYLVGRAELELQEAISQAFHSEGSDMSQKSGSGEQPE